MTTIEPLSCSLNARHFRGRGVSAPRGRADKNSAWASIDARSQSDLDHLYGTREGKARQ
jgi:hypothetical protein